jgi:hypothetical protein
MPDAQFPMPVDFVMSLNISDREAHLTLVPIGQIFRRFGNWVAAAELSTTPARLAGLICQQTTLANTLRGKHLIFH